MIKVEKFYSLSFKEKVDILNIILVEFKEAKNVLKDIYLLFSRIHKHMSSELLDNIYLLIYNLVIKNKELLDKENLKKIEKISFKIKNIYNQEKQEKDIEEKNIEKLFDVI